MHNQKGCYIQIKDVGKGQRKMIFDRNAQKQEVLQRIVSEFNIDLECYHTTLLSSNDEEVQFATMYDYHSEQQSRYKGTTRLYIGNQSSLL